MARIANSWWFRAEAMRLDWLAVLRRRIQIGQGVDDHDAERVRRRGGDVHLWWACAKDVGVPREPFTVWQRSPGKARRVRHTTSGDSQGTLIRWGGAEAATIEVTLRPQTASAGSTLLAYRGAGTLWDVVGAATTPGGGDGPRVVVVRCSGATSARLVNGTVTSVRVELLADAVNDPSWQPLEEVGLPVEQPWHGADYDTREQGLVASPLPPVEAAVDRLRRGTPPLGWPAVTQAGHLAPPWVDADPYGVVKEVQALLLPQIASMYDLGTPEPRQHLLESLRTVDGPRQGPRTSSLATTAIVRPFSLLALPAQTDPLMNLATGFGTTYFVESGDRPDASIGRSDLMVTATWRRLPSPRRGKAVLAAFAPQVGPLSAVPAPTNLTADRSGLVAPATADRPWRESIHLSWDRVPTTAALGRVGAGTLARYPSGAAQAVSLAPPRDAGGERPLTLSPDGPPDTAGASRVAFVDGGAEIPVLSGGRDVGYAVSVVDVHGLWSAWRDVHYVGDEPGPLPPRLIALDLTSSFTGSTTCPATLALEVALDWTERTPTTLQVVAMFFPMADATTPPPSGLDPSTGPPTGCFRRDLALTFAGDVPTGVGCAVTSLAPDGETTMGPGPGQGDGGRRYRMVGPVPSLDFAATNRWGVQVWLRSTLVVGASPTAYAPDSAHPARASAASPVPVQPIPPPAPPGVPLGSTVDAAGCSHVRVHWSLPAGGDVRTCVVWEVAETSLRQRAEMVARAPDTDSPGVRLAALWAAYDALPTDKQRGAFRRVAELPGTARSLDVPLPKGSTDIHLFTVTTQSSSGIESPWPGPAATGHVHLQAVIAPRLRTPTQPLARAVVQDDGTVTVDLMSASTVPVQQFLVFATRSFDAARDRESMGPPLATVAVTATPTATDPLMGSPIYRASWTGALPASWDTWYLRAVAVPVETVPVEGVRGLHSPASEITTLTVLPAGSDLEPLSAQIWGADHRGVVVRSSTNAPPRATSAGSHRVSAMVGVPPDVLPQVPLEALPQTAGSTPPTSTASRLERGPRAAGRSPLVLWLTRPVATDPVTVVLRLTDPLGRLVEQTVTVPGWVPPPPWTLELTTVAIRATGVLLGLDTDAPATAGAGVTMRVRAVKSRRLPLRAAIALEPDAVVDRARLQPPVLRPTVRPPVVVQPWRGSSVLDRTFVVADLPRGLPVFADDGQIHAVRWRGSFASAAYAVWVPFAAPFSTDVTLAGPDGQSVTASLIV